MNIPINEVAKKYCKKKEYTYREYIIFDCPNCPNQIGDIFINPDKNIFHCKWCKSGGDVITLMEKIKNISPLDSVKFLIKEFSLQVPKELKGNYGI